jgi:hypothetical protein
MILFKKETLDTDFYIWKITSQAEVEWENLEIIPNMQLKSYELFIDHRYMIVLYLYPKSECVVRHMSDFSIKENIYMMCDFTHVSHANGFVFLTTGNGELL